MIHGTLDRFHMGDLLQWLQMGGLTGRLTLTKNRRERRLDFLEGRIVFVSSQVPRERLATWLATEELLPEANLKRLLGLSILKRNLFTDEVLHDGTISEKDLSASLTRLAESVFLKLMLAEELDFVFDPGYPIRDLLNLSVSVDPQTLLMEAARQSDESDLSVEAPTTALPASGEAFEKLFWELIREGVSGDELIDGQQVVDLHKLVGDIMRTLVHWLASGPGLVPLPDPQTVEIAERNSEGPLMGLMGFPHAAWNQVVLDCSIRSEKTGTPLSLESVEESAAELDLWTEMTSCEGWQRPPAGRLDELTRDVATTWARAAAAAAPLLGVEPRSAVVAAHLLTVPTDLMLWVLTTLPVPHRSLRKTILRELPKRLGCELAYLADFPPELRALFECRETSALGATLHIGRRILPSGEVWPETIPGAEAGLMNVIPAEDFARAAEAAKETIGSS